MRALPRKSNFRIVLHKLTVLCHHEIVPSEQEHGLKVSPFNEQFNVHEKLLDKLLETKYGHVGFEGVIFFWMQPIELRHHQSLPPVDKAIHIHCGG